MTEIPMSCSCGAVKGTLTESLKPKGRRLKCYCRDCQTFANFLEKGSEILDESGGTDIYQITPAQLRIDQGTEHLGCVRLSPKGLFRWYTQCCKTPIGNTVSGKIPFIGVAHNFFEERNLLDENLGPVVMSIQAKDATGTPDGPNVHAEFPTRLLVKSVCKMVYRGLTGQGKPNPFFSPDGNPICEPVVLSKEQRSTYLPTNKV